MRLWSIPDGLPFELIGRYDDARSPDHYLFRKGRRVRDHALSRVFLRYDISAARTAALDALPNTTQLPVVTHGVAELIANLAPESFEPIPVIVDAAGKALEGYVLLNVTTSFPVLDRASSRYSTIPGTDEIMMLHQASYLPEGLRGHHLVRDAAHLVDVLLSDALADRLLRQEINGLALPDPCSYYR